MKNYICGIISNMKKYLYIIEKGMEGNTPISEQCGKEQYVDKKQSGEKWGQGVRRSQGQDSPHRPSGLFHLGPYPLTFHSTTSWEPHIQHRTNTGHCIVKTITCL